MELITKLNDWFDEKLTNVSCSRDTKAYIVGVLAKYKSVQDDMSKTSVVLSFVQAKQSGRFESYQRLGDWVLFISSVHPAAMQEHTSIIQDVGMKSYVACHNMMMKKWPVYEELAIKLPLLSHEIENALNRRSV